MPPTKEEPEDNRPLFGRHAESQSLEEYEFWNTVFSPDEQAEIEAEEMRLERLRDRDDVEETDGTD